MPKSNKTIFKIFSITTLIPSCIVFVNLKSNNDLNILSNKLNTISTKQYTDKFKLRKYYGDNQKYKLPIYESPYCDFYDRENYSQAPNFREISLKKYNSNISNNIIFDSQGWPTLESCQRMTYLQLFLNEDVARYFDEYDNPRGDIVNLNSIYNKLSQTKEIDLSPNDKYSFYLNDEYADETIKCLNNPLFYLNINGSVEKTDRSIFSQVNSINLANNNLSFIPFFGYVDLPSSEYFKNDVAKTPIKMSDLFIANSNVVLLDKNNKQKEFNGFNQTDLKTFDFRNNHLINLPITKKSKNSSSWDLSYLFSKSKEGKILLDGNYLKNNISYYYKNKIVLGSDPDSKLLYQTSGIIDYDQLAFELSRYYLNDQLKLNVNPANLDLESVNKQLYDYIPDSDKQATYKPSNKLGNMMCYFITKFIDTNYLSSVEKTACEFNSSLFLIIMSQYSSYMFGLINYSNNNGQINLCYESAGTQKATCVSKVEDGKNVYEYNVEKCNASNGEIITLQYKGYNTHNINEIITWILVSFAILFVVWLIIYYSFLKKILVNKKIAKDKKSTSSMERK